MVTVFSTFFCRKNQTNKTTSQISKTGLFGDLRRGLGVENHKKSKIAIENPD